MDELFLEKIQEFTEEDILADIDDVYRQMCEIEKLSYEYAYGFGNEGIKEYICSIILLKFIDLDKKKYIKSAIRLLIIGTFGPINFCDFIEYVCSTKLNINEKTFKQGLNIIEEKYPTCINSELTQKNTKKSSFIDLDEYLYILDNVNYGEKFRKNKTEMEIESERQINEEVVSNKKNTVFKIVVIILCIIACALGGTIIYLLTSSK